MKIDIRYCGSPVLSMIEQGDWIDLYTCEDVKLKAGEFALVSLGVAMKLPEGYEANIVARSSTAKKWGVIQANCYGVIDNSYSGDNDVWKFPMVAFRDTSIPKYTRICQFRLNKTMRAECCSVEFNAVEHLNNADRGGFGSTDQKVLTEP